MQRYFIYFQYHGGKYHGWQLQPNAHTVQAELEKGMGIILQKKIELTAAGRTDTGVHAKMMVAHFDLEQAISVPDFIFNLNNILPADISVTDLLCVEKNAHARFDAISRTYHYYLHSKKDPFFSDTSFKFSIPLDFEAMNQAAKMLIGKNDFSCFSKSKTQTFTNDCELFFAEWKQLEKNQWRFEIKANRFLRNMVRAIVGTLLEVGQGRRQPSQLPELIASKDRSKAGTSAPAHGLYLVDIEYP